MEKGVKRWFVDISAWDPSPHDVLGAMSLLPRHEHSSITRFVKLEDRKRALVSRLLQYALVHQVMGIPYHDITINRTPEGKPYLVKDQVNDEFSNFNFSTSHHGDYVAIASEPLCLVGLDIVSCLNPKVERIPEFLPNFSSYFSVSEWSRVMNSDSDCEMLDEFYRYWCLKESYIKGTGIGVGCRLDRVEFHHTRWNNISAKVDGNELKDWKFSLSELGKGHWVSVAKGHPRTATVTYKWMLKRIEFDKVEYDASLHFPEATFILHTVEQLLLVFYSDSANEII